MTFLKKASAIFGFQWVAKPSTSRRQFLLFAAACRSAEAARRRGVSQQVACENFLSDMRLACQSDKHRRLIGVSRVAACRRSREGLGGKQGKSAVSLVRDWLLKGLKPKNDISVGDLETGGGLLSPEQGPKKCPRGQVREPITGRCVPKGRRR